MNSSTGNTNLTLKAKQALDLVSGKKNVVQAQRGEHYRVVGKNATGEEQLQDNVIARKKGSDLVLRYADGTELQLENYYIECKAGDCDITLPSGTVEGFLVSAETSMGAALADGSTLSYAYGNPSTLMQMAQTDASLTAALTGLQGTMVTYHPVDVPVAAAASSSGFGLWTALGALGVVAGAARWEAGHSDTAAATATPDNLVQGQLTAGPTVSGHGLGVDVFQADGKTLLGHVKINPDGSFTVNVGAYTGVIIAKITDENTNNDYMDEASGEAKDLDDDVVLMAVANVSSGITVININPITTIAALKAGMTSNGELGNSATLLSKEQVTGANAVVASALGLDNILITKPVTTVIADGTANPDFDTAEMSAGETYGALLASLSGVDQTHGTAATIQLVEAGIVTSGNLGVVDSATKTVLEQGATTAAGGIGHALAAVVKSAIDSSSVTELTTESNIVNALLAIRDASDNNNSAQTGVTAATFSTAGITGVDDNNIAAIQSALNSTAVTSDQVSNTSKIQALVDAYSAILSGADDDAINNNANATAAQYTMLGVTGIAASNITLVNDVVDGLDGSKIDTIGELQALSDATNAVISGANGGTAPTLEQLVALGIQDVNASNLSAVQKAIADSGNSGTGIDSLAELQALVTSVPPTITSGAVATALNENSGAGQAVYTATADDSSAGVTFTLGGTDAALLSINASSGVVSLKADPDFENKESYSFTVSASDAAGNSSSSKSVSLAINDLDELAPTITSGAVATALNENSGAGQAVYTAQSTDTGDVAVGATVYTLALGSDAGLSINSSSGAVTLTGSPDFESKASYSFTVVATDAAGNFSSQAVSLDINNLDEVAPTITSGAVAIAINENSLAGQVVYTAQSTDTGDVAVGATVYTLALGSDAGLSINSSSGAVTLTGSPDFESKASYSFTVVVTDAAGNFSSQAVSLDINNLKDTPDVPLIALGSGVANGATAAEATNAGGVVSVSAEAGVTMNVTFTNLLTNTSVDYQQFTTASTTPQAIALTATDIKTLGDGNIEVTAKATDVQGHTSTGIEHFTLDTVGVSVPSLVEMAGLLSDKWLGTNDIANGLTMQVRFVNGAGDVAPQVGDSVTLRYGPSNGTLPIQTELLDSTDIANGFVNFALLPTDAFGRDGAKQMIATVTDAAGNITNSNTKAFTLDTYVPTLKITENGTSLSDGMLSDTEANSGLKVQVAFTKTGSSTAKVNDKINLQLGEATLKSDVLDSADLTKGYVEFNLTAADLGLHGVKSLAAVVVDLAGNIGSSSQLNFTFGSVTFEPLLQASPLFMSGPITDGLDQTHPLVYTVL